MSSSICLIGSFYPLLSVTGLRAAILPAAFFCKYLSVYTQPIKYVPLENPLPSKRASY